MKFIQHRANDHKILAVTPYAEIDVWVADNGELVVKHDVKGNVDCAPPIFLVDYLKHTKFEKFFVDIKQSLSDDDILRISRTFGPTRLLGMFDIPWPSFHRVVSHNNVVEIFTEVFARFSEHEMNRGAPHVRNLWLDPLDRWKPIDYLNLIERTDEDDNIIIASPELHGCSDIEATEVWRMLGVYNFAEVTGIVTKWPQDAKRVIESYA